MLVIKNLVKKYHNNTILNNLSYVFEKGNLYIIRGDNGSGKSTLLKILSKISYKTSGEISGNERIAYLHDKPVFPYLMRVDDYLKTVIKLNNSNANYLDILEDQYALASYHFAAIDKYKKLFNDSLIVYKK